jgi:hypothetical protein
VKSAAFFSDSDLTRAFFCFPTPLRALTGWLSCSLFSSPAARLYLRRCRPKLALAVLQSIALAMARENPSIF